jgi:hypothetical protein
MAIAKITAAIPPEAAMYAPSMKTSRAASSSCSRSREERTGFRFEKNVCMSCPRQARRTTLSPGDRADPGLASMRSLDWPGLSRRHEGFVHVHQTHRHATPNVERSGTREDRCLVAPPTLKGGAARKVANKLIAGGLVAEIAKAGDPIWRLDDGSGASYALRLTAAGAKVVAVDEIEEPQRADQEGGLLKSADETTAPSMPQVIVTLILMISIGPIYCTLFVQGIVLVGQP